MPAESFLATILVADHTQELPGRGGEDDLVAISTSLGGPADPMEAATFLADGLAAEEPDTFASRFLSELMLRPPIPAGCVALIQHMASGDAPWLDHEVLEDRAGLFTAHALAHRVAPSVYPAPSLPHAVLRIAPAPPPSAWRRPRPRTLLAASAIGSAPDAPASCRQSPERWAFDTLWHVGVDAREGAVEVDVRGAMPWLATLEPGFSWNFEHS